MHRERGSGNAFAQSGGMSFVRVAARDELRGRQFASRPRVRDRHFDRPGNRLFRQPPRMRRGRRNVTKCVRSHLGARVGVASGFSFHIPRSPESSNLDRAIPSPRHDHARHSWRTSFPKNPVAWRAPMRDDSQGVDANSSRARIRPTCGVERRDRGCRGDRGGRAESEGPCVCSFANPDFGQRIPRTDLGHKRASRFRRQFVRRHCQGNIPLSLRRPSPRPVGVRKT